MEEKVIYTMNHYYQTGEHRGNRQNVSVHNSLEEVCKLYAMICQYCQDESLRPTVWIMYENGKTERLM